MGLVVIIRNCEGEIMASCCELLNMVSQSVEAEALALRKAVELCIDMGFSKVIFEGDVQVVIKAVESAEEN